MVSHNISVVKPYIKLFWIWLSPKCEIYETNSYQCFPFEVNHVCSITIKILGIFLFQMDAFKFMKQIGFPKCWCDQSKFSKLVSIWLSDNLSNQQILISTAFSIVEQPQSYLVVSSYLNLNLNEQCSKDYNMQTQSHSPS